MERPCLYIVSTPIGHIGDLSPRARQVLSEADVIACEDTRNFGLLAQRSEIAKKKLVSYHDHGEKEKAQFLVDKMVESLWMMALVSDAGTPAIADPGFHLVAACHQRGVRVSPVPGPCAFISLVACSGLPSNQLNFRGFLPTKTQALGEEIEGWREGEASVIVYESPKRLKKTLEIMRDHIPKARIALGRELTKTHEQILVGTPEELLLAMSDPIRGEICLMIDLSSCEEVSKAPRDLAELMRRGLSMGFGLKDLQPFYRGSGMSKKEFYRFLLELKEGN